MLLRHGAARMLPGEYRGAVGITEEFRTAYAQLRERAVAGPELLPTRLAKACTRVLPIAGAGISMFTAPTMRIPIGASDDTATIAERLQFTVAQGPCIDAHHTGQRVVATEPVIAERWPVFHDRLITHTPVRGIVAVPLGDGLSGIGALDLYCHRSADVAAIDPADVDAIAGHITTLVHEQLFPDLRNGPFWDGPRWLNNPSITGRGYVLMAMGVASVALALPLADALAILRAHAFAADRTVDDTAHDIVTGSLSPYRLTPDSNS